MPPTNREMADTFETVADLLQLKGENIHRVLAYRHAADSLRELPRDVAAYAREGTLTDIPFIGDTLAEKITEMLETGKLQFYERLAAEVPPGVVHILRINGVGPKKAMLFYKELGIDTVEKLEKAARAGKLRDLAGMGAKSEQKIIEGIEALARQTDRQPLGFAQPQAQHILDFVMEQPGALKGAIAGSIRRARPTIGDVDLLVASHEAAPIMDAFVTMPSVARVLGHGPTKSSVELHNGLQVDLRVLEPARWGTALNYFTGSQAHNIKLREIALTKGFSLNEHAFRPADKNGNLIEGAPETLCATEEEVYALLGLPYIPPELRENAGEIEAAMQNRLPKLLTLEDMHADLHMHTTWSDGKLSIREMAEAAKARGRQFIVITDHSAYSTIANGLSVERILQQQDEVRRVDAEMGPDFRVFHGVEMDIRTDGTLDYPDEVLAKLDFVIASLHFGLRQERAVVTRRLLNAINNPHVDLIGHPRGQYIPDREPADLDMDAVFAAAKQSGIALEINANPRRLDLEAGYARRAVEMGIPLAIDTDAHSAENLDLLYFGVLTARRGWVTADSVLNTWPLERFLNWVQNRGK